jgi:hypothetical protein
MLPQFDLLPGAISELFAEASISGKISVADRYGLLAAMLNHEGLSDEERDCIDRLLRGCCRGRITLEEEPNPS